MTVERFKRLAEQVTLPGGMVVEAGYDGWKSPPSEEPNFFLRVVSPLGACNETHEDHPWKGRKWRLSPHMTDGEVIGTAFKAYLTALEHEAREQFLFQGVPVYDSHVDIHKLVALRKEPDSVVSRHGSPPRCTHPTAMQNVYAGKWSCKGCGKAWDG